MYREKYEKKKEVEEMGCVTLGENLRKKKVRENGR